MPKGIGNDGMEKRTYEPYAVRYFKIFIKLYFILLDHCFKIELK